MSKMEEILREKYVKSKNGEKDKDQERLNEKIQDDKFLLQGLYMPFVGDPNARFVSCHLNPGGDFLKTASERQLPQAYNKCLKNRSVDELIKFLKNMGCYAAKDFNNGFDGKQLRFFYGFDEVAKAHGQNTGLDFDGGADLAEEELDKVKDKKQNQRNLFNNKLQLELIPYMSRSFNAALFPIELRLEYFYKLLDEIFSKERSYILMLSVAYIQLLNKAIKEKKLVKLKATVTKSYRPENVKTDARALIYQVSYQDKNQDIIVAPSFQGRAVQSKMNGYEYGKFCAKTYFENR